MKPLGRTLLVAAEHTDLLKWLAFFWPAFDAGIHDCGCQAPAVRRAEQGIKEQNYLLTSDIWCPIQPCNFIILPKQNLETSLFTRSANNHGRALLASGYCAAMNSQGRCLQWEMCIHARASALMSAVSSQAFGTASSRQSCLHQSWRSPLF